MNTKKPIQEKLIQKELILNLAAKNDFSSIIEQLQQHGVKDDDIGEFLLGYADFAVLENRLHTAIIILKFIAEALEDKSEADALFRQIGSIYNALSEYEQARLFFGKLPLTFESIMLCFETYKPELDVNGLLHLRDTLLLRIPQAHHIQLHQSVDQVINDIINNDTLRNQHQQRMEMNWAYLKTCAPFINQENKQGKKQIKEPFSSTIGIINIADEIYYRQNCVWKRLARPVDTSVLPLYTNIMVHCDAPDPFFRLLQKLETLSPEVIKYECRIIIDFDLLEALMPVCDMGVLCNCNFIIRFIDKNEVAAQLTHILLERKLPFTNQVIYFSKGDPDYFSDHVMPVIKTCEQKINHRIADYENTLNHLYHGNVKAKTIAKIDSGQPLNILFFSSRFTTYMQYSIRDISEGFKALGHRVRIEIEDSDSGVSIRKDVCLENLIHFKPDIIFTINHFRINYPWVPKEIPFVTWIQDLIPQNININSHDALGENDFIFSFSKLWINGFFQNHPVLKHKEIFSLPITVDTQIYRPLTSCDKKYDITLVTHLPHPDETYLPILSGKIVPEATSEVKLEFMRLMTKRLSNASLAQLNEIQNRPDYRTSFVKNIINEMGIQYDEELMALTDPRDQSNAFSRFTKHMFLLLKTRPISILLKEKFNLRVFGKNWNELDEFKAYAMGPIDNGAPLNRLINESCINLNMSPGTTYHMKAPEVIAAGGFMLTYHLKEAFDTMPITDYFKEGKEIILFEDESDLVKKVRYYITHKSERDIIINAARNRFCTSYGVLPTAETVIRTIRQQV